MPTSIMNSPPFGPSVRIICRPKLTLEVQVRDPSSPSGWRLVEEFPDSDEHQLVNATTCAIKTRMKLKENERV